MRLRWPLVLIYALLSLIGIFAQESYRLAPEPGIYKQDQSLSISVLSTNREVFYRFLGYDSSLPISSDQGPVLSASDGQTRSYDLEIMEFENGVLVNQSSAQYIIDKQRPLNPLFNLVPGRYFEPVNLGLVLPDESDLTVKATVNGQFVSVQNNQIELKGETAQSINYRVSVWTEDPAGNNSERISSSFVIDRRNDQPVNEIPVFSPVEGNFLNQQLLYIDDTGFSELRYTLNGEDPKENGVEYLGPEELPSGENQLLRIYGLNKEGMEFRREISFSSGRQNYQGISQGFVIDELRIPGNSSALTYTTQEREPTSFDSPLDRNLVIRPQEGSLRILRLRIFAANGASYRYFFILDGRTVPPPNLSIFTTYTDKIAPVDSNNMVGKSISILGDGTRDGEIYYSINDDSPEMLYNNAGSLSKLDSLIPIDISVFDPNISLKAQRRNSRGQWSSVLELNLERNDDLDAGRQLSIEKNQSGSSIILENDGLMEYRVRLGNVWSDTWFLDGDGIISIPPGVKQDLEIEYRSVNQFGIGADFQRSAVISLDRQEITGPRISVTDRTVNISGSGSIYYRILSLDSESVGTEILFTPYTGTFELPEKSSDNVVYIIESYALSEDGEASSIQRSPLIPVHNRNPRDPSLIESEERIVLSKLPMSLSINSPEPGVRYYYRLDPKDQAFVPDDNDPFTEQTIVLRELDSEIEEYVLNIVAVSEENSQLRSSIVSYPLLFDITPPAAISVQGVENGSQSSDAVSFNLTSQGAERIYFSIQKSDGTFLYPEGTIYQRTIRVDGEEGKRIQYRLLVQALDGAGNKTELLEPFLFSIDKEVPNLPSLTLLNLSNNNVLSLNSRMISSSPLQLQYEGADSLLFEVDRDGGIPSIPNRSSSIYRNPILFSSQMGEEKVFTFRYRLIDDAGNLSEVSQLYTIIIDQKLPDIPRSPSITREGNTGRIDFFLDENTIEYALLSDLELQNLRESAIPYKTLVDSIDFSIGSSIQELILLYRAKDAAGNIGPRQLLRIPRLDIAKVPQVIGIENRGLYNQVKVLSATGESGGVIRYEFSTDGSDPPEVSEFSPIWSRDLSFSPNMGETVDYTIHVRQYIPDFEPSDQLSLRFTIDRDLPLPPEAINIDSFNYTQEGLSINFQSAEGQIFYHVDEQVIETQSGPPELDESISLDGNETYVLYREGLSIQGTAGLVTRYEVSAFTRDSAGNDSAQVRSWVIYLDRKFFYLSKNGTNRGRGTRFDPIANFSDGITLAQQQGYQHIAVTEGQYAIPVNLAISSDLVLYGGLSEQNWTVEKDKYSLLYPSTAFSKSNPSLITVRNSSIAIQRIYLADGGLELPSLILLQQGAMIANESSLGVSGDTSAIQAISSEIELERTRVSSAEIGKTNIILLSSSQLKLEETSIEVEESLSFLSSSRNLADYTLIQMDGGSLNVTESSLIPRSGQNTIGIQLNDVAFEMDDSQLFTGFGTQTAIALIASRSTVKLNSVELSADSSTATSLLLRVENTDFAIRDSDFNLSASFGAYGLLAQNSSGTFSNNAVIAEETSDFVTMFSISNSQISFEENELQASTSSELTFALLRNSQTSWLRNNIMSNSTSGTVQVFYVTEEGSHDFNSNTMVGQGIGIAFHLGETAGELTAQQNALNNFAILLLEDNPFLQANPNSSYLSVEQLEAFQREGVLFEDNSVQQGL